MTMYLIEILSDKNNRASIEIEQLVIQNEDKDGREQIQIIRN